MNKPATEIIPPDDKTFHDDEEGRVVAAPDLNALMQLNSAEINQQILTARAYPRSINTFRKNMTELVTYSEDVAASCLYALKRGKGPDAKIIEGPSIRFAEAAMQSWGNARAGSRIVDIGDEFITAQGFFYDLEKNMALTYEVLRRITTSQGHRYGDDMIGVTGNAACSIAIRNAITKGIPKAYWNNAYLDAKKVAVGGGETINTKRQNMLKAFTPWGVDPDQIFGLIGVKGIEDVTIDHMIFMAGVRNAIKDGDVTPEEAFAPEKMSDVATPPRPRQSEFNRNGAAKTGEPEKGAAADSPKADEKPEEPRQSAGEAGKVDQAAEREAERQDWVSDAHKELAAITKVRDIPALEDRILNAGVMTEAEEKAWSAACDARGKEIMAQAKAGKAK